jgi:hypothetical protein
MNAQLDSNFLEMVHFLFEKYKINYIKNYTNSLSLKFIAKQVYNWDGKLVRSLSDVPKLDKCLQSIVNEVEYAPVWISKGEAFDSRGALFFIENLLKFTKTKRKELVDKKKRLNNNLKFIQEEQMQIRTSAIRIIEINEALKPINAGIDEFNSAILNLESVHSGLQSLNAEQMSNGYESLFKHIKSISTNEKIFGGQASKGVKLKVFFNGTDDSIDVFFNLKDWSVSNENSETQKSQLYQLLSEVNQKVNWYIQPDVGLTVGDLKGLMLNFYNISATTGLGCPFVAVYTKIDSVTPNAASWYKSRKTLSYDYTTSATINTSYALLANLKNLPYDPIAYGHTKVNATTIPGNDKGPFDDAEQILFFAISTASNSAAGLFEFIASKFTVLTDKSTQEFAFQQI